MANELTQQELADRTGVTRQTIVAIENMKYSPTLELAFRISHVFNKPLNEVFSYQYDEDPVLNKKIEDNRLKTIDNRQKTIDNSYGNRN
jgi:putative transcriptional regulator